MSAEAPVRASQRLAGEEPEFPDVHATPPMSRRQTSRTSSVARGRSQDPSEQDPEEEEETGSDQDDQPEDF